MTGILAIAGLNNNVLYNGTMTQGSWVAGDTFLGYSSGVGGSMSPTGLVSPATWTGGSIFDDVTTGGSTVAIAGFGVTDPTANYFTRIKVGSGTQLSASRTGYSFSGGVATWTFPSIFGLTGSGNLAVLVTK